MYFLAGAARELREDLLGVEDDELPVALDPAPDLRHERRVVPSPVTPSPRCMEGRREKRLEVCYTPESVSKSVLHTL